MTPKSSRWTVVRRENFLLNHPALSSLFAALIVAGCSWDVQRHDAAGPSVLRLAVTTSTRDSGLLDVLLPVFEQAHNARVDVIAVGTGAALKLGEAGDVDVVLVHARQAEEAFMAAGHGVRREEVMYNTFQILGPPEDPAGIRGLQPAAGLQKIASRQQGFVSRGDESGTHKREQELWEEGSGRPAWADYVESGQGMGATLTMADQMNAYVLSDRGTYLKFQRKLRLVPLITSSASLRNPYGLLVVNPAKHRSINGHLGRSFADFMISNRTQQLIRDYQLAGQSLFYPLRLGTEQRAP